MQIDKVSVAEALHEAVATNASYGQGAQVRLVCDTRDVGADRFIAADWMRLQQIFSNLISNAVKYSPRGGEVRIGAELENGNVRFWIRDSGPGIPSSARERIFQRFTKPVHSKEIQASGTGLGLAITKELAERQNASIDFDSITSQEDPENSGTTFHVTFQEMTAQDMQARAAS